MQSKSEVRAVKIKFIIYVNCVNKIDSTVVIFDKCIMNESLSDTFFCFFFRNQFNGVSMGISCKYTYILLHVDKWCLCKRYSMIMKRTPIVVAGTLA